MNDLSKLQDRRQRFTLPTGFDDVGACLCSFDSRILLLPLRVGLEPTLVLSKHVIHDFAFANVVRLPPKVTPMAALSIDAIATPKDGPSHGFAGSIGRFGTFGVAFDMVKAGFDGLFDTWRDDPEHATDDWIAIGPSVRAPAVIWQLAEPIETIVEL